MDFENQDKKMQISGDQLQRNITAYGDTQR